MILSLSTYRGRVSIVPDRYPKQAMRNVIRRAWGPNPLPANMRETVTPGKFNVEGESGSDSSVVVVQW